MKFLVSWHEEALTSIVKVIFLIFEKSIILRP